MSTAMAHKDHGRLMVSSKGLASKGIALLTGKDENGKEIIYVRVATHFKIMERVEDYFKEDLAGECCLLISEKKVESLFCPISQEICFFLFSPQPKSQCLFLERSLVLACRI